MHQVVRALAALPPTVQGSLYMITRVRRTLLYRLYWAHEYAAVHDGPLPPHRAVVAVCSGCGAEGEAVSDNNVWDMGNHSGVHRRAMDAVVHTDGACALAIAACMAVEAQRG